MFDPNTYKDEWTKNNSSGSPTAANSVTTSADTPPNTTEQDYDTFRHFDGTKAEVSENITQKFTGNTTAKQNSSEVPNTKETQEEDLESEATDIINTTVTPNTETEVALPENATGEEADVVDEIPEAQTVNEKDLTDLEKTLLTKSSSAKSKIDNKISKLKLEIDKLTNEITGLNSKKDELDKLAIELKDKLHQFDEEINEI